MCAMSLLHSRVGAVVFVTEVSDRLSFDDCTMCLRLLQSNETGAFRPSVRLHSIKALNHHFDVFQLTLTNGCCCEESK